MYGINEIKKQSAQAKADHENSRKGTYCVLRDGSILLRSGVATRVLDSEVDTTDFLESIRGRSSGIVRKVVQSHFESANV
jgi:hypothetical protein